MITVVTCTVFRSLSSDILHEVSTQFHEIRLLIFVQPHINSTC